LEFENSWLERHNVGRRIGNRLQVGKRPVDDLLEERYFVWPQWAKRSAEALKKKGVVLKGETVDNGQVIRTIVCVSPAMQRRGIHIKPPFRNLSF
jgi:hypothetical protein